MKHLKTIVWCLLTAGIIPQIIAQVPGTPYIIPSASTPCTTPTALNCSAIPTSIINNVATTFTATGGGGGIVTWEIKNSSNVVVFSGAGLSTTQTITTDGNYSITFTSTNNSSPVSCSPAATTSCTTNFTVVAGASGISCLSTGSVFTGTYRQNISATGATQTLQVSVTTAGPYPAISITVNGVTWAAPAGTFTTGTNTITFTATGTPTADSYGTFTHTLPGFFGGCTFTTYTCGAIAYPYGNNKLEFLCHNLGANTALDPNDFSTGTAELNGAYIQWGKKGPYADPIVDWRTGASNGAQGFAAAPQNGIPNDGIVTGWNTTNAVGTEWQDATKTANDPCPTGWRIPTGQQIINFSTNNGNTFTPVTTTSWTASSTNYGSAIKVDVGSGTSLSIPASGHRTETATGNLVQRGQIAYFWTSTYQSGGNSTCYSAGSGGGGNSTSQNRNGFPIRCVAELCSSDNISFTTSPADGTQTNTALNVPSFDITAGTSPDGYTTSTWAFVGNSTGATLSAVTDNSVTIDYTAAPGSGNKVIRVRLTRTKVVSGSCTLTWSSTVAVRFTR